MEENNNNNLDNDNVDMDVLDTVDDNADSTYTRFDFETLDLDDFLYRLHTPRPTRKRNFYEAPEFVQRLNAFEEARAGSTVIFECKWKGCPKPSIKWYKDDEEITENPRYGVTEESNGALKLTIENACKEDEGAYKVKAENSEGVSSSTGYLSVTGDVSDRPLAAQPRKNLEHSVSFPPHLRTIVEQKSLEEREAEELSTLPPSPIQNYIDSFRRGKLGPLFPGCSMPPNDDDEGECMEQDDSDSTSVESQTFEDELFIQEDDDDITNENPFEEAAFGEDDLRPVEISLDYSKIAEVSNETLGSEKEPHEKEVHIPSQPVVRTVMDIPSVFELPIGNNSETLAEDFEEFMKTKRKNVGNENFDHNSQGDVSNTSLDHTQYSELQEPPVRESSSELPDIIQNVSKGTKSVEAANNEGESTDTNSSATVRFHPDFPDKKLILTTEEIELIAELGNTASVDAVSDVIYELPWLYYLALASASTLFASCSNVSPLYYVLFWLAVSFVSFNFCIKEKPATKVT